ncbi:MAG: PSD1 and planctomycete cytochrome C domain-containing protein [Planctomycetes bacterium]|nr:PSD1 and planctomycete cytochrome C domain-containing protein [Planctomycetota bacterium]
MPSRPRIIAPAALLLLVSAAAAETPPADPAVAAKVEFFEKKVRPILVDHCHHCHSADTKPAGGLRVDDRNGLFLGGNTGPAVVPGNPEKSLLLKRIGPENAKRRMPLEGKHLTEEQTEIIAKWIKDGAAWPAIRIPASLGKIRPEYEQLRKEHWAWQPLTKPAVPAVNDAAWARDDIDRFLLAKLDAKGLKPVGDADKVTLIRRVTFDLTGLPPTPAEIDAFVKDSSPNAFEQVVDRLLASSAFGERWGRHWLDVARYGESTGPSRNIPYPHAWKYRDYVIDSVNADVPYDRFLREQIAGDLLAKAEGFAKAEGGGQKAENESGWGIFSAFRLPPSAFVDRLLTATGFLALGVKDVNQRFKVRFIMDNVDEQIDTVTRSILGLTVSCARCHDHKFDPVPTTDYYAIAGIFTSTDNAAGVRNLMGGGGLAYYVPDMLVKLSGSAPPADPARLAKLKADFEEAKKAWDAIRGTPAGTKIAANGQPTQRPYRLKFEALQTELNSLTDPAARGQAVHGVRDAKTLADTEVRIRGEAEKLGPIVPRGFLTAFTVPGAANVNPKQSGRLELANWLTSAKNPLTPRVAVNRIWQHLFGTGIVNTVDNFGVTGGAPSHPELLDHLANRFIADDWSVKKLVRAVVLTHAYQLSAEATPANTAADPGNRLVWRHTPRRLTAEEIRDATLAAAGTLDVKRPGGSPAQSLRMVEMLDNGPEARTINEKADASMNRSVYLPLLRGVVPHSLEVFDPAEQTLVTGNRDATTVPSQALYLLNGSFVRRQSLILAERLLKPNASDSERITEAYRRALGRAPTKTEVARARAFLDEYESESRQFYPDNLAPAPRRVKTAEPAKVEEPPFDPDQVDQTGTPIHEDLIRAKDARTAAWLAFTQALFGSAEFRYVR